MTEKFKPPLEDLPPLADLMAIADVAEEDIQAAADKWRKNPPSQEFRNLLNAEENGTT